MTTVTPQKERYLAALIAGVFIGLLIALSWLVSSQRKSWEECYVDRMDDAKTKFSSQVLANFCRSQVSPKQKNQ